MDGKQFDAVVRRLHRASSRRDVMHVGLGALTGATVATIGQPDRDAAAKKKKKKVTLCHKGQTITVGKKAKKGHLKHGDTLGPCPTSPPPSPPTSPPPGTGTTTTTTPGPTCLAPNLQCGADCIDPRTDDAHCGGCDQPCEEGEVCADGLCFVSCPTASSCESGGSLHVCSGGLCVSIGNKAVCATDDDTTCTPHVVPTCDGDPCPEGRGCATICCGPGNFVCMAPV